jgi:glycosyltransferase involved in cell wall biosynthesis
MIIHINLAKGFRGGERQTMLFIEELSKKDYHQKLIVRQNSDLASRLEKLQLSNLEIIAIGKPYFFHLNVFNGASIVHAHETKAAQLAYFVNMIYHIPYIITRRVDNSIKNNFFNKKMYENAFCVVVLSKAIEYETLKISPKIKIKIIPSAYTKLQIDEENVKMLKKRFEGKFVIGNIGELDNTHKGQYYLIEAAKMIEKKYPKIHFIFLGRGKDEENYRNQSANLSNITFEGFVDNVGDYIACMDGFAFPSLNEGLGSILLDIMQAKVPIVASDVGGIPDIIKDNKNGLLVEVKNAQAIFEAIEKIYLNQTLREKLANEAYKTIENFSKEMMCERYERIYGELK